MPNKTDQKRSAGRYFTVGNPFDLPPFTRWAQAAGLPAAHLLEPFAGANHITNTLQKMGWANNVAAYDIRPAAKKVRRRDTLKNFPKNFSVCATNPPWLARNSATRRGLPFPATSYDNVYKHCLSLCLANCEYVAALLPASYLQTNLFQNRLTAYILLHKTLFADTENPVCLALFTGEKTRRVNLYHDQQYIGNLHSLRRKFFPAARQDRRVKFNDPAGQLGFISFDNTVEPTIKFCEAAETQEYNIKQSSRFITRISGDFNNIPALAKKLNRNIQIFRENTADTFLTPFKGLRQDGQYRRRMEFAIARNFINAA